MAIYGRLQLGGNEKRRSLFTLYAPNCIKFRVLNKVRSTFARMGNCIKPEFYSPAVIRPHTVGVFRWVGRYLLGAG